MNKALKQEIATTKKMIKYVEKGAGKDKCKGYYRDCPNCESHVLKGYLEWHLQVLEWDFKTQR